MKHKTNPITDFSVRMDGDGDEARPIIAGYAARFDEPAHGEVIRPGAFTKTLAEQSKIVMLWNHDMGSPMASTANESLKLWEDEKGLRFEARPNIAISWARDTVAAIEGGEVSQMSFGFDIIRQEWSGEGESLTREILEVRLYEVSAVTFPWYETTEVSVRGDDKRNATTLIIEGAIDPERAGDLAELVQAFTRGDQAQADEPQNGSETQDTRDDSSDTSAETQESSADAVETDQRAHDWEALKNRIEKFKGSKNETSTY